MKYKSIELGLKILSEDIDRVFIGANTFKELENKMIEDLINIIKGVWNIVNDIEEKGILPLNISTGLESSMRSYLEVLEGLYFNRFKEKGFNNTHIVANMLLSVLIYIYFQLAHRTCSLTSKKLNIDERKKLYKMTDELLLSIDANVECEKLYQLLKSSYSDYISQIKADIKENKTNSDWDKSSDGIYTKSSWDKKQIERANKYFKKALDHDYMHTTEDGYEWTLGGGSGKIRLSYFLREIFNPEGCERIPYKDLEILFAVSRIDSSINQLDNTKGPHKWKQEIDANIFNDKIIRL